MQINKRRKRIMTYGIISIAIISIMFIWISTKRVALGFLFEVGVSMLSGISLTFLYKLFAIDEAGDIVISMSSMYNAGVEDVSLASRAVDFTEHIMDSKVIDLCFDSGNEFITNHRDTLARAYMDGCEIRLLVSNPALPHLSSDAGTYTPARCRLSTDKIEASLVQEILDTEHLIDGIRKQKGKGSIQMAYANCYLTGSFVLFDGKKCFFVPYIPYAHSSESIRIALNGQRDSAIVSKFAAFFENAWADRSPIPRN